MLPSLRHPLRVLALVVLAAALNAVPIRLPGGIPLFLGPFVYLPMVLVLPRPWAILAAAVPSSVTVLMLGDPFTLVVSTAEAAWLALFRRHSRVAQDSMYWLCVGAPLTLWLHLSVAQRPVDLTAIVVLKQALNHLSAVLIAGFLVQTSGLGPWLEGRKAPRARMREMVFQSAFVLSLVPVVITGLGMAVFLRSSSDRADREALEETSQRLSRQLSLFLTTHRAAVETAARLVARGDIEAGAVLAETRRTHPAFLTLLVADAAGELTHTAPSRSLEKMAQRNVSDRPYFREVRDQGAPYVSGVFRGRGFGRDLIMAISAPIVGPDGSFRGIVQAALEVQTFARAIVGKPLKEDIELIFCDTQGRVIYADPRSGIAPLLNLHHSPYGALISGGPAEHYRTVDRTDAQTGSTRLRACAAQADGINVIVIAQRRLLAGLEDSGWVLLLFGTVALGIVAAAVLVERSVRTRTAVPLEQFAADAARQAEARTVQPIQQQNPHLPAEVEMAFNAFNQLAVQLQQTHAKLRRTNEELDQRVIERTAEAEAARRAAEAASQSKTDFLATTGHEIRTPLNAIIGLAESLIDKTYDPIAVERLRTIQGSGQRLLTVVNDLLDLSRVEAGRIELRPAPVDLQSLAGEILSLLGERARQKGTELTLELTPPEEVWVNTDGPRLLQVLINLVGNALKFTPEGKVTLRIERQSGTADSVTLRFAVIDTGPGISREQQSKLFQPYVQLEGGLTSSTPGSGLGLSISRRFVALFGGTLAVTSEPGHGAEFYFTLTLPRAQPPAPAPAPASDRPLSVSIAAKPRVLAADDNPVNQEVLRSLIEDHCAELVTVESAADALTELEKGGFDVALIDLEMPVADGFYVAQVARSWSVRSGKSPCRLIAISAHQREEIWARCQASGFDEFVGKPIDRKELLRAIREARPAGVSV